MSGTIPPTIEEVLDKVAPETFVRGTRGLHAWGRLIDRLAYDVPKSLAEEAEA